MTWVRAACFAAALLAAAPALAKRPLRPGERIDLNRASAAELMRLPKVGERRAEAIVALRARRPFRVPADVLAVKGLGPAWFRAVKDHVTVAPPDVPAATAAPAARSVPETRVALGR